VTDVVSMAVTATRAHDTTRRLNVQTCRAVVSGVGAALGGLVSDVTSLVIRVAAAHVVRRVSVYRAPVSHRTSVCATSHTSAVTARCPYDAAVPSSVSTAPYARGWFQARVGHRAAVSLDLKALTVSSATSRAVIILANVEDSASPLTIVPGSCASVVRRTLVDAVRDDQVPLAPLRLCLSTSAEAAHAKTTATVSTVVPASSRRNNIASVFVCEDSAATDARMNTTRAPVDRVSMVLLVTTNTADHFAVCVFLATVVPAVSRSPVSAHPTRVSTMVLVDRPSQQLAMCVYVHEVTAV